MNSQASPSAVPLFERLGASIIALSRRHGRYLMVVMLLLLHVAALRGVSDGWARALLLAHFGLLLLWQPFLQGDTRVTAVQALFIGLVAAGVSLWLNWWLLSLWIVVLSGLVGGKVYQHHERWQRLRFLAAFVYLLALLVIIVLPEATPNNEISPDMYAVAEYGLPLLILLCALLPAEREAADALQVSDFFYSVFLMLLIGVVVLGSFTYMTIARTPYLESMMLTVFTVAGVVLAVGLTWGSRAGLGGLSVFFTRYLLSISLPMERWLFFLSELSRREQRPERFLDAAVGGLLRLPWVSGAEIRGAGTARLVGQRSPDAVPFESPELSFSIYSHYRMSPSLHWHLRLLAELLNAFHLAKLRERLLLEQSYLQAVHETGARVTHDVKNILQSLQVLCSVLEREGGEDRGSQALLRTQLPALALRLNSTLLRLQDPVPELAVVEPLDAWWAGLQRQYPGSGIAFEARSSRHAIDLPKALFDSVADNLLQNALAKRAAERTLLIRVALEAGEQIVLSVTDDGAPIAQDIAENLFRTPVESLNGLGIGLYQAARQARAAGFALRLAANRPGEVRFVLEGQAVVLRSQGNMPAEIIRP